MIIDCISDLHGYYPELKGGDLLIVAGDIELEKGSKPSLWLEEALYKKVIWIAGNHDNVMYASYMENEEWLLQAEFDDFKGPENDRKVEYLCDSGTEFEGLKIWGSPWTKRFEGMNPNCMAFTVDTDEELAKKWELIPDDVDILITHCPSFGNLDPVMDYAMGKIISVGSISLWMAILQRTTKLQLHVFGHVHSGYGKVKHANGVYLVNASHVDECYDPINKPIRVIL